jgi:hypothetical protein
MLMLEILGVGKQEGEVGIEIELEGSKLPTDGFGSWRAERDGSLRGESVELVLKHPCPREKVSVRLDSMLHKLEALGSEIHATDRAGIHAHINIQELTEVQLVNFICLYLTYENMLVEWCGNKRVGNLFCLRTCDASGYLDVLRKAVSTGSWTLLYTDQVRYASMNLKAVCQYGSLEFRAMRSTVDIQDIETWVKLLLCLKDAAKTFINPIQIVEQFSVSGPAVAYASAFNEMQRVLKYDPESMLSGLRNAQMIAYCRADWERPVAAQLDEEVHDVLEVVAEEHMWQVFERAEMDNRVHMVHEGIHWYKVCTAEFEEDEGEIGRRWFTSEEVLCHVMVDYGGDEAWNEYAKEYLHENYYPHAKAVPVVRKAVPPQPRDLRGQPYRALFEDFANIKPMRGEL